MTERDWDECADLRKMLALLQDRVSERKLRLFAVACCRRIWHLLADARSRGAVEVAEKYADGLATAEQLRAASREAVSAGLGFGHAFAPANAAYFAAFPGPAYTQDTVAKCAGEAARAASRAAGVPISDEDAERVAQRWLLRDLFRYPLCPAPRIDPASLAWNDGTIPKLAQTIYDDRAFDRLPILADALEEAGCADAELLAHLRGPGPHARGCWCLDLLLAKE